MKTRAILFGTLLLLAPLALAQGTVRDAMSLSAATIISPVSCTKLADLYFGIIMSDANSGMVVVHEDGSAQTDHGGASTFVPGHRAEFKLSGSPDYRVDISHDHLVYLVKGDNSLMANIKAEYEHPVSLDTNGEATLYIGGILHVPGSSASGHYVGTFQVTVSYF